MLVDESAGLGHPLQPPRRRRSALADRPVGQGQEVQDDFGDRLAPAVVLGLVDLGQQARQEGGEHGAGPVRARHRTADQGLDVAEAPGQGRRGGLDAQHVVGVVEPDQIGPRGVAEGEVAGFQHRLAPALGVHASPLELEMQVEHAEAAGVALRVDPAAHLGRRGMGAHQGQFAQFGADHLGGE